MFGDLNEFLRIMTAILIILLVIQGLDLIFGVGVNNYVFVIFCITFAFTIGAIYQNIIQERRKSDKQRCKESVKKRLKKLQEDINKEYEKFGLTDEVLENQVKMNEIRNEWDLTDETQVLNDDGFTQ